MLLPKKKNSSKKKKILPRFPVFSKNCEMCVNILREKKQSTETVSMCPQMLVSADKDFKEAIVNTIKKLKETMFK